MLIPLGTAGKETFTKRRRVFNISFLEVLIALDFVVFQSLKFYTNTETINAAGKFPSPPPLSLVM
jgi:hypothetical protein